MSKSKRPKARSGRHFTIEKGHRKRVGAKPGNKNPAKGPRIGRHEPAAPVAPHIGKHRQRRKRTKTGGRDFDRGANSHDGRVFQRGPDMIPRGNATLMLRVVANDFREKIYRSLSRLVDTPKGALAFMQEFADRTEGRPVKMVQQQAPRGAVFILTTKDGREEEMFPPRPVGSGATTAATAQQAAVDAFILGTTNGKALKA